MIRQCAKIKNYNTIHIFTEFCPFVICMKIVPGLLLYHGKIKQNFLSMEFVLQYVLWELLRQKIPESHVFATIVTGNGWLFNGKRSLEYQISTSYCGIFRFWDVCVAQSNGKFTLNLCDAQVFKTKNSEKS